MTRIKMLKTTMASGVHVYEGETYEVTDRDAKYLIVTKKAVLVAEEAPAPAPEPTPKTRSRRKRKTVSSEDFLGPDVLGD